MDKHYTADDLLKLVSNLVADTGTVHTHMTTGTLGGCPRISLSILRAAMVLRPLRL